MKLARYYHTLRFLRPVQVYSRVHQRIFRPRPDLRPAPPLREGAGAWTPVSLRRPSMPEEETFTFLNETRRLSTPDLWNDSAAPKLWLYNLHYFDDLNAPGAEARRPAHERLLRRWIAENPPGQGVGWEAYPVSLRIVNWIKWALAGHVLPPEAVQSLAVQARHLARRLEWHLLANHLLVNAKALVFAGLFFSGPEAEGWLECGLRVLRRELREQVLPDGGHFERSPMYHALVLEDLLDLENLRREYAQAGSRTLAALGDEWAAAIVRMRRWLQVMCHPDGEIALLNDAALEIAPPPTALESYAGRLGYATVAGPGEGITHLPESGYVRLQKGPAVVLLDVGELGPDYNPAHGHADTLSFELSLFGERVIVDSGTSTYAAGTQRQWERSTAAHNTVEVDGADSSETWGSFRVARRARPLGLRVADEGAAGLVVHCGHDGYRRLPGRPLHFRTWRLTESELEVRDEVAGEARQAVARFHLHPHVKVEDPSGPDGFRRLISPAGTLRWQPDADEISIAQSTYHPAFGMVQSRCSLAARWSTGQAINRFAWS